MFVSLQHADVETLTPVGGTWREGLGESLSHKSGTFVMGLVLSAAETQESMGGHSKQTAICKPEGRPHQTPDLWVL